jgi:glycosyltransferase involved in cell wall biosynthesis
VVTPVYNGGRYLAECIESVLAQTHENWDYVIVDNCSTDDTPVVARRFAELDDRIRVHTSERHRDIIENWNYALRQISPESAYCKVLHADDLMTPDCLERMVAVGAAHPNVGIVTSYRLSGTVVDLDGAIPYEVDVVSGREICRRTLLDGLYVFGSPSSLLVRSDLIRARERFYNEANLHADTEVCFDVLRTCDLGFVPQVLTHTRRHAEAMTSTALKLNTYFSGWIRTTATYGPYYLTPDELAERLTWWVAWYGYFLAKATVRGMLLDDQFRRHHLETLRMVRRLVPPSQLGRGLLLNLRALLP